MRRFRTGYGELERARCAGIVGLCLLSFLVALGAAFAPGASASEAGMFPEYASCVKLEKLGTKYTGAYTNKECTAEATSAEKEEGKHNRYELQRVSSQLFEGTSRAGATIVTHGTKGTAESVICRKGVDMGAFEESDVYASYRLRLEKCSANGEKADPCGSEGKGLEEIETKPLFSTLVWLNKARTEPGILLEAEGERFARFKCAGEQVELAGYLVGAIENTKKGHTVSFALNAGKQAQHSFWVFGSEVMGLDLYTLSGSHHVESTLETVEAQSGTGVY